MSVTPPTGSKKKRKDYLSYLQAHGKVPRQTRHNWRKCKQSHNVARTSPTTTRNKECLQEEVPVPEVYEEHNEVIQNSPEQPPDDDHYQVLFDEFPEQNDTGNTFEEEGKILYPTSDLTVGQSVFLVLKFFIKHSLNKQSLRGLLDLIWVLLPKPNNFPSTIYLLNKIVYEVTSNYVVKKHYYCKNCSSYIMLSTDDENHFCSTCEKPQNSPGIFVELPLENVLQNLMEGRGVHKFYDDPSIIVNQGTKYDEIRNNVLTGKYDIVLAWNTDGVPVFKSSDLQLWPLQITFLDIPPAFRHLFISVCGLWIGSCKPNMNTFLKPFCESISTLFNEGFIWMHPVLKVEIKSRVLVPLVILDAPARALVLNMNQFNGKYGCPSCIKKGEVVLRGRGKARIYKGIDFNLRSDEQFRQHGERALEEGIPIFGIKGPTWVSAIPHLNLACSFSPDYMHCVLLGVVRHFLFLWLDTANHNNNWYIGDKVSILDAKLLSIKPPSFIQRLPRSLTKRKLWKASEFRSWLLFYSLPTLNGIILEKYLQHWMILVHSIFILLKDHVSDDEIDFVETLLKMFVLDISELYCENVSCTFNSHQLLHLCTFTKNWGPLWVSSAFNFETNNGVLLRLIHGSQSVSAQLVNTLRLMNGMWLFRSKYHGKFTPSCLSKTADVVGLALKRPLPSCLQHNCVLNVLIGYIDCGYKVFQRANIHNEIYTSEVYKRQVKYNNYSVIFDGRLKYGAIQCFLKKEDAPLLCVIRAYHFKNSEVFFHKLTSTPIKHLVPIRKSNIVFVINIDKILDKVIVVNEFLSVRPNKVENLL